MHWVPPVYWTKRADLSPRPYRRTCCSPTRNQRGLLRTRYSSAGGSAADAVSAAIAALWTFVRVVTPPSGVRNHAS